MKKEKKRDVKIFSLLKTITPKIVKISPAYFAVATLISIIHGLFWGVDILVRQYFFDAAADLATGAASLRGVLIAFAALAFTAIFTQFLNGVSNYQWNVYGQREMQAFQFEINERIQKARRSFF